MKIGIIGYGVVGKAIATGFELLGHSISIHDTALTTTIDNVLETEIIFVCVPTPSNTYGDIDMSIVSDVVQQLDEKKFGGIVALKSTCKPTSTDTFHSLYPQMDFAYVPEFLRERCATDDFMDQHELLIVGTSDQWVFDKIVEAHGHYPKNIQQMTFVEAEITKYFHNTFAAMRVVFANTFYEISNATGANYQQILDAGVMLSDMPYSYLNVNEELRGYAGPCLPKDVQAMQRFCEDMDINGSNIFKTIHDENENYKKTVFKGMRK